MTNTTGQKVPDITEGFDNLPIQLIQQGENIQAKAMYIQFMNGPGSAGITTYNNVPGMHEGPVFGMCIDIDNADPAQEFELGFKMGVEQVDFFWTWLHRKGVVSMYDENGGSLGEQSYSGSLQGGALHQRIVCVAPPGKKIWFIRVVAQDYSFLDFFSLYKG